MSCAEKDTSALKAAAFPSRNRQDEGLNLYLRFFLEPMGVFCFVPFRRRPWSTLSNL